MPFTNTVCRVETQLSPLALFTYLQAIEIDMGREKFRENGPRIIDLDLLNCGTSTIDLPGLTVPHPRMHERAFVLEPLQEIAPDLTLKPAPVVHGTVTARIPLQLLQAEIAEKKEREIRAMRFQEGYNQNPCNWDSFETKGLT